MTLFPYDNGVPAANDDPSKDQPIMLQNAISIAGLIATDHVGFNFSTISPPISGGFHNVIHFQNQSSSPPTLTGVGQLYTKTIAGDQQLFYKSGGGIKTQLTGPNETVAAANGFTWIGGILMQWGSVTFAAGNDHLTGTANFTINFPTNCFIVIPGLLNSDTSNTTASNTIAIREILSGPISGFRWVYNSSLSSGSTKYPGFYWVAIGN